MNTNSDMRATAGVVIGARHARMGRNGQDACATSVADGIGIVVVADGCGSGESSEVGARLGAALFARALRRELERGKSVLERATWEGARSSTAAAIGEALERLGGERALSDHFLFTIVAAAATSEGAAVWALGDGAYAVDGLTVELGPFADNQPPYLAYDLVGNPHGAHFGVVCGRSIVIATDGAVEAGLVLGDLADPKVLANPDGLRRKLALLARGHERIDWDARCVQRVPAVLQDDCAVAVLAW